MRDFYDRYAEDLAQARRALAPRPGQIGALVAVAGTWVGLDLLPSPGLFERAWPRLCAGYAAEAVGREEHAPAPDPHAMLKGLAQTPAGAHRPWGWSASTAWPATPWWARRWWSGDKVAHLIAFPARYSD